MMVRDYPYWLNTKDFANDHNKSGKPPGSRKADPLRNGKKIELAYDIDSDDFFQLASLWCDKGAKISKGKEHFIVSLKGFRIPPND